MKKAKLDPQYAPLIKSIRRKRRQVILLTVIAILLIVLFVSPLQRQVFGSTLVQYSAFYPIITVALVLISLFVELVAYSLVSLPLSTSLEEECDPQKHMILNSAIMKEKQMYYIYTADHFYLGDYAEATAFAERMIADKRPQQKINGWFELARCAFMNGDTEELKRAVEGYGVSVAAIKNAKPKTVEPYEKMQGILDLMCMIMDNDLGKLEEHRRYIEAWNKTKIAEGFVNYVKGVAACVVGDKGEAIYRLMFVKDRCSKTILATKSDDHLGALKW